ncbi:site-specific integrase [Myxococcota bacterium]|nr:site-specific integrase [Myxococcota bacterium]
MNKPRYKRPAAIDLGDLHVSIVRGPNAEGRWYWRARDADRATVWTGWATRDEAAREAAAILARPKPVVAAAIQTKHASTMGEVLDLWWSVIEGDTVLRAPTKRCYLTRLLWLRRLLAHVPVSGMNRAALQGYLSKRIEEGAALRSIYGELISLRHAWRIGVERELIPNRPLPSLKLRIDPKVYVANHRTPTEEEVTRALAELPSEVALTVQLLAATGARLGEVIGLRRNDLDRARGTLRLDGKTGPRGFPVTEGLLSLLSDRLDGTDAPVLHFDVKEPRGLIRVQISRACARAGVPEFTPHGLRRMAVDRMARAGVEPSVAASITGHDPNVMLQHYRAVSDDDLRLVVQRADLGWFARALHPALETV